MSGYAEGVELLYLFSDPLDPFGFEMIMQTADNQQVPLVSGIRGDGAWVVLIPEVIWSFNRTNDDGRNYVRKVCDQVENNSH